MKISMSFILWLVLGAITWFSLVGYPDAKDVLLGLPVIVSAWALAQYMSGLKGTVAPARAPHAFRHLLAYGFKAVLPAFLASPFRVARAVLFPSGRLRPAIVAVPLPEASPDALLLLAFGISLSADEQVVAVDDERRILYIHGLDVPDPAALRRKVEEQFRRHAGEATPP